MTALLKADDEAQLLIDHQSGLFRRYTTSGWLSRGPMFPR
jgi:hypothetical protein